MQPAAVSIGHLTMRYGPTTALDAVDLRDCRRTGPRAPWRKWRRQIDHRQDAERVGSARRWTIAIFGQKVTRFAPRFAHDLGIRTAFQEISLVKDLTVAQNFMLMEEPLNPIGMIRGRAIEEQVRHRLEQLGITSINPRAEVRNLDLPSRQKVEIARAVSRNPRILLLDEPTASLSSSDVQWLGELIQRLKESATTVVLISHRMQEVRDFCSALSIFRNGRKVGAYSINDLADAEIIELMIGRSLGAAFPAETAARD